MPPVPNLRRLGVHFGFTGVGVLTSDLAQVTKVERKGSTVEIHMIEMETPRPVVWLSISGYS